MTINYQWISDAHLDHLNPIHYQNFLSLVRGECSSPDTVLLITGDTTTGRNVENDHINLTNNCLGKTMFVLGNHDRWNSSFADVERRLKTKFSNREDAFFLDVSDPIKIDDETFIVGDSGWYDGRNGLQESPRFIMNDWYCIKEYIGHDPFQLSAQLADACAIRLESKLRAAIASGASRLIVLTHVPPFAEASRHLGRPSDFYALPWFSSQCTGDVLEQIAAEFQHVKIEVLCGHTHDKFYYKHSDNLVVHVAGAAYGNPCITKWQPTLW